jgi:hypothetical protein
MKHLLEQTSEFPKCILDLPGIRIEGKKAYWRDSNSNDVTFHSANNPQNIKSQYEIPQKEETGVWYCGKDGEVRLKINQGNTQSDTKGFPTCVLGLKPKQLANKVYYVGPGQDLGRLFYYEKGNKVSEIKDNTVVKVGKYSCATNQQTINIKWSDGSTDIGSVNLAESKDMNTKIIKESLRRNILRIMEQGTPSGAPSSTTSQPPVTSAPGAPSSTTSQPPVTFTSSSTSDVTTYGKESCNDIKKKDVTVLNATIKKRENILTKYPVPGISKDNYDLNDIEGAINQVVSLIEQGYRSQFFGGFRSVLELGRYIHKDICDELLDYIRKIDSAQPPASVQTSKVPWNSFSNPPTQQGSAYNYETRPLSDFPPFENVKGFNAYKLEGVEGTADKGDLKTYIDNVQVNKDSCREITRAYFEYAGISKPRGKVTLVTGFSAKDLQKAKAKVVRCKPFFDGNLRFKDAYAKLSSMEVGQKYRINFNSDNPQDQPIELPK